MATILELRQNLRWPRNIFQIVWSKVHESTEKTLTGKGQFLPGSALTTIYCVQASEPYLSYSRLFVGNCKFSLPWHHAQPLSQRNRAKPCKCRYVKAVSGELHSNFSDTLMGFERQSHNVTERITALQGHQKSSISSTSSRSSGLQREERL